MVFPQKVLSAHIRGCINLPFGKVVAGLGNAIRRAVSTSLVGAQSPADVGLQGILPLGSSSHSDSDCPDWHVQVELFSFRRQRKMSLRFLASYLLGLQIQVEGLSSGIPYLINLSRCADISSLVASP
jgi:hypothetical protein